MATLWEIIIKSQISRVFKICGCWGHADNVAKSCVEVEWCVEAMTIIRIPRATSSVSPSTHIYRMFTVYHLLIMLFYSFFFLKKISAVFEIWFFFPWLGYTVYIIYAYREQLARPEDIAKMAQQANDELTILQHPSAFCSNQMLLDLC